MSKRENVNVTNEEIENQKRIINNILLQLITFYVNKILQCRIAFYCRKV